MHLNQLPCPYLMETLSKSKFNAFLLQGFSPFLDLFCQKMLSKQAGSQLAQSGSHFGCLVGLPAWHISCQSIFAPLTSTPASLKMAAGQTRLTPRPHTHLLHTHSEWKLDFDGDFGEKLSGQGSQKCCLFCTHKICQ